MQQKLIQALRKKKLLDDKKVGEFLRQERETGETLDKILIGKGLVSEGEVLKVFAEELGIPFLAKLADSNVPAEFLMRVPINFARTYSLVGLAKEGEAMKVATCSPLEIHPMDDLASLLGMAVEPVLATKVEIANLITNAYERKSDAMGDMITELSAEDMGDLEKDIEQSEDLLDIANKAPIIKLVHTMLYQALKMRATDIHVQPTETALKVRFRIDGVLYDMPPPPKKVQEAILSRIKVMGKMDIAERRAPQDGRATIKLGEKEIDLRISSVPTAYGERIAIRILDKHSRVFTLNEIGLEEENQKLLRKFINYSNGMIFVTGPTGSGKSSTLYACLTELNSSEYNIMTIEDPIEYNLPGVSQVAVQPKKNLTFAEGLRTFLRQDPDIIMVGEVRDEETARTAVQAALTGHQVFSTLHTNDAAGAVSRLLDLQIEPYLVASSLLCVVAQRLVRLICPTCKAEYRPSLPELSNINIRPEQLGPKGILWAGTGCEACINTGYMNRVAIFEILPVGEKIKGAILLKGSAGQIKQIAIEDGLRTLRMDGIRKIVEGRTTIKEVLSITQMDVL